MPPEPIECTAPRLEAPVRPVTCSRMREWVIAAKPNLRLAYGRGWYLKQACSAELGEYVRALADLGLVTPHQQRGDGPPVYFVQRTSRPVRPGARL